MRRADVVTATRGLEVTAAAGLGACARHRRTRSSSTVTMSEFTIDAPRPCLTGTTFVTHNVGGADHEMVIIHGPKTGLPTSAYGG